MQATLTDCTGIDTEIKSLLEEIDVVTELTKRCIAENSQMAQNQEEYAARYNGFVERYEKAKAQLEQLRATNPTAPWRSWHGRFHTFVSGIYRLYKVIRELSIRSERFTTLEFAVALPDDPAVF